MGSCLDRMEIKIGNLSVIIELDHLILKAPFISDHMPDYICFFS